ncbi:MAG: sulfatase-like hydrolase/transferase [Xanthomonadales bacterium]|nr:sulfatase-like hydrolase/transferase [Xanthomonadales bacterium]
MNHSRTNTSLVLAALVLFACSDREPTAESTSQVEASTTSRPNIIFIMADDHAYQAIGAYGSVLNKTPNIDRLAAEGMRFDRAYVSNSICSPARAATLTGKHSHVNGVRDNRGVFDGSQQTFPKLLQQAGYQTALIGKWHLKSEPTGFDYWRVLPGQGFYYQPEFRTPEGTETLSGYVTDVVTDLAIEWLENGRTQDQPFLLMFGHKAPHREWLASPDHLEAYKDAPLPEPETLFDDYAGRGTAAATAEMRIAEHMGFTNDGKLDPDMVKELGYKDFMEWYQRNYRKSRARMTDEQRADWDAVFGPINEQFRELQPHGDDLTRWKYQRYMQDYLASINSVDDNTGRLLDYLEASGLAENTVVIYTSDQGFFLGEHGWFDKRFMYEESFRTPLIVRWPGTVAPGSVSEELVQNIDTAPTLLDIAGVEVPGDMQGVSVTPLLVGSTQPVHDGLYYHYYEFPGIHTVKRHYGLATKRYKLIHFYYDIDEWELYDLENDPGEMLNVYGDPAYADVQAELHVKLNELRERYGDSDELTRQVLEADLRPGFESRPANVLSEEEAAEGFHLIFDGQGLSGWRGFKMKSAPARWVVDNGLLTNSGPADEPVDLVTDDTYGNFELRLQWMVSDAGDSGILFNVVESDAFEQAWQSGPEIQILDNDNHPDAVEKHLAGDLYDLLSGWYRMGREAGKWNQSMLRVENGRVRHWLNGLLVIDTVLGSPEWRQLVANSKFSGMPGFGTAGSGVIALRDQGSPVWFRSIRIKEL